MSKILDTQEFLDTICELLYQGKRHVAIPVAGGSMVPFLHHGDMVCLDLVDSPLKRGDIILYQRAGGRYILHRIMKIRPDGTLWIVGDAQQEIEILPSEAMVRARVTSARHKGKTYDPKSFRWWLYAHIWLPLRPFRHLLMGLRGRPRLK
ncbi:MAG: S24/S26 family peptidase [Oscillospiraceae bacterium]|nr:S24/S26 family peptidase [Oscillospiraceae bacterium]